MKKAKTQIDPPKKLSKAELAAKIADECNDRLFVDDVLKAISYAANHGRYRCEWLLPRKLRGYRIPQNLRERLRGQGFVVDGIEKGDTTIGLIIVWGVGT